MRGWDGKNVEMGTGDGNPGVKGVETLWQCGIPKVIKTGRNREKRFLQHCAIFAMESAPRCGSHCGIGGRAVNRK